MPFKPYSKIHTLGYSGTEDILQGDIYITPKVDGSNASIWISGGKLVGVGKRTSLVGYKKLDVSSEDYRLAGMFEPLVKWAEEFDWSKVERDIVLFGEMAQNQNKLKYETKYPFICFDAATFWVEDNQTHYSFVDYSLTQELCSDLSIPCVPLLYSGSGDGWNLNKLEALAERDSFLGGSFEEGIVIKRYDSLNRYNEPRFAKLVVAEYREKQNQKTPRLNNNIGDWIAETYLNKARLNKAIQRMKEDSSWNFDVPRKNIGPLIGYVCKDIHDEAWEEIKEEAAKRAWKDGARIVSANVAPLLDSIIQEDLEVLETVLA